MLRRLLLPLVLVVAIVLVVPIFRDAHEIPPPTLPKVDPALEAHAERAHTRRVRAYVVAVEANRVRERLLAYVAAVEAGRARERARAVSSSDIPGTRAPRALTTGTGSVNGHPCGGALPPCYVLQRESGGTNAQNPDGRSASGYWQIQDATWGNFMGYARAVDAPAWVQDARAAQLAPCNWEPPNYCAG